MKTSAAIRRHVLAVLSLLAIVSATGCESKPPAPTIDLQTEIKDPATKPTVDKVSPVAKPK